MLSNLLVPCILYPSWKNMEKGGWKGRNKINYIPDKSHLEQAISLMHFRCHKSIWKPLIFFFFYKSRDAFWKLYIDIFVARRVLAKGYITWRGIWLTRLNFKLLRSWKSHRYFSFYRLGRLLNRCLDTGIRGLIIYKGDSWKRPHFFKSIGVLIRYNWCRDYQFSPWMIMDMIWAYKNFFLIIFRGQKMFRNSVEERDWEMQSRALMLLKR